MTTIEKVGARLYAVDAPFSAKDKLKSLGCHWDGDRRQWWVGAAKAEALAALVAEMNAAPATPASEDLSKCRVYAQVEYKNKRYYVVAEVHNSGRCRLTTLDGPLAFWVDMADCVVVRTYDGRTKWNGRRGPASADITVYPTVGSMKSFRDRQKADAGTGRERVCCQECGSWFTLADGCPDCGGC